MKLEKPVNKILGEIESSNKPTIMVFNKIDAYQAEPFDDTDLIAERTGVHYSLEEWKKTAFSIQSFSISRL